MGLTPEEKSFFSEVFKSLDPENTGIVTGEKARSTFEKSGLPPSILGEIWQLADTNNLGFLTQFGFCYAMRLIGYTQAGYHPSAGLGDTPGPLPKFANLGLAPLLAQATRNISSAPTQLPVASYLTSVPPTDVQKFSQLFVKTVGSTTGELGGTQARDIFMKAKLPTVILGQIWSLVDRYNTGQLGLPAFVIAMHLIQGSLSGQITQLPTVLPESIWQSATPQVANQQQPVDTGNRQTSYGSVSSQATTVRRPTLREVSASSVAPVSDEWVATPTMKQQYASIFNNLEKGKSGHLNPNQVASFLMTSKLGEQDLATIWDLSDTQNTGIFGLTEFSIALFLVNRRLAGGSLPNIVPHSLIESLSAPASAPAAASAVPPPIPEHVHTTSGLSQVPQQVQQPLSSPQKSKSAMDDLVDIFGSSPVPAAASVAVSEAAPPKPALVARSSSSDLTPSSSEIRKTLTGSFRPTSNFGQSLMQKQQLTSPREEKDEDSLLGEDVNSRSILSHENQLTSSPAPAAVPQQREQKVVNYEALRSVPPPPVKRNALEQQHTPASSPLPTPQEQPQPVSRELSFQQPATPQYYQQQNDDLLADSNPEISGQLSQANSDIANVSNQIKSLATQTTSLHEKKLRAENELQRILATKVEIESKLKQLRTSYQNEVKQVDLVESNLASAKEETEALRSEASISEAKFNSLSTELHEKQVAQEELQKQNNTLKEKLGTLNAEIAELEKQVGAATSENQKLANQASVKKSQTQVAIVKSEELKSKIRDLQASHAQLQAQIDDSEQKRLDAEAEQKALDQHHEQLAASKPTKPSAGLTAKSVLAGGAVGAALGGVAAAAGSYFGGNKDIPIETPAARQIIPESTVVDSKSKEIVPEPKEAVSEEESQDKEIEQPVAKSSSEKFDFEESSADETEGLPEPNVDWAGDAEDKTVNETKFSDIQGGVSEDKDTVEEINLRFPDLSVDGGADKFTSATATSSVTTDFKGVDEGETPVTSPSNSDFQFPQGAGAGIVGGMVGMPGVLVGVQRTDSLTSSVQNNAALSVRDDNIDDISDRDTIDNIVGDSEETVPNSAETENFDNEPIAGHEQAPSHEDSSDGDKVSSGVESFEIVNAEEARAQEAQFNYGSAKGVSEVENEGAAGSSPAIDEEFPPIRELEYDEYDSSDNASHSDKFDDAVDDLPHQPHHPQHPGSGIEVVEDAPRELVEDVQAKSTGPFDEFDNGFDELEPTTAEHPSEAPEVAAGVQREDLFADEFDNLEEAQAETGAGDDIFGKDEFPENALTEDFTEAGEQYFAQSRAPDFSASANSVTQSTTSANDEWEQLFAGFGNAVPATIESSPTQPSVASAIPAFENDSAKDASVQELVGMGFDQHTVLEALEKLNWELEAATNYLLDNA